MVNELSEDAGEVPLPTQRPQSPKPTRPQSAKPHSTRPTPFARTRQLPKEANESRTENKEEAKAICGPEYSNDSEPSKCLNKERPAPPAASKLSKKARPQTAPPRSRPELPKTNADNAKLAHKVIGLRVSRFLISFEPPALAVDWAKHPKLLPPDAEQQEETRTRIEFRVEDLINIPDQAEKLVLEHEFLTRKHLCTVENLLRQLAARSLPVYRVVHENGAALQESPTDFQGLEHVFRMPRGALAFARERTRQMNCWWIKLWSGHWMQESCTKPGIEELYAERCQLSPEEVSILMREENRKKQEQRQQERKEQELKEQQQKEQERKEQEQKEQERQRKRNEHEREQRQKEQERNEREQNEQAHHVCHFNDWRQATKSIQAEPACHMKRLAAGIFFFRCAFSKLECESILQNAAQKEPWTSPHTFGKRERCSLVSNSCTWVLPRIKEMLEATSYFSITNVFMHQLNLICNSTGAGLAEHLDSPCGNREATVLVYLNTDYDGGQLKFRDLRHPIRPCLGDGFIFDAPRIFHEALPVKAGRKWTLVCGTSSEVTGGTN